MFFSTSILQFYIAVLPERQGHSFTAYNWDALLLNGDLSHALLGGSGSQGHFFLGTWTQGHWNDLNIIWYGSCYLLTLNKCLVPFLPIAPRTLPLLVQLRNPPSTSPLLDQIIACGTFLGLMNYQLGHVHLIASPGLSSEFHSCTTLHLEPFKTPIRRWHIEMCF